MQGKVEFEAMEEGREDKIITKLVSDATRAVFSRFTDKQDMENIALHFANGINVTTGESIGSPEYESIIRKIDGLDAEVRKLSNDSDSAALRASAVEFILEGLHLNQLLNKDRVNGRTTYRG